MARTWVLAATLAVAGAVLVVAAPSHPPIAEPRSGTVPIDLDHNRMTIDVEFVRVDGSRRVARAWVDTGAPDLHLAEPLARELGLDLSAMPVGTVRPVSITSHAPAMRIDGVPLDSEGLAVLVSPGRVPRPGVQAECVLPARALRRLHVVFDYPARRVTVARPGVLSPRGTLVPCRVNPETGLFMIDVKIDGQAAALGVDTGSAGTWVSETLVRSWLARQPDWPRAVGAAGSANFFGFDFEAGGTLLRLPALAIGDLRVTELTVLGLDQSLFDWYSKKSAGVVAGFLGANVLTGFRLEVDFPAQKTYWTAGPARAANDIDIVGLTLRPERDGGFSVVGVVSRHGDSTVPGVLAGDRLLQVDALEAAGTPMGRVIDALRGQPGAVRTLLVERAGRRITVRASVVRLP